MIQQERPRVIINIEEVDFPPTALFVSHVRRIFEKETQYVEFVVKETQRSEGEIIERIRNLKRSSILLSAENPDAHLCAQVGPLSLQFSLSDGQLVNSSFLMMSSARCGKGLSLSLKHISGIEPPLMYLQQIENMVSKVRLEYRAPEETAPLTLLKQAGGCFVFICAACQKMIEEATPGGTTLQ